MTSDQEAVCGTCGGDPRDGNGYHAYDCPERTGPIPVPVVPSDDAPRREQYATSDEYRAAMVEWALSAPPTPSQDAEGDDAMARRAGAAANDAYEEYRRAYRIPRKSGVRAHWQRGWEARGDYESSIRADYEELVKALLRHEYVQSWLINFKTRGVDGLKDAMEREYDDPDSMVAAFGAALTRIEESQKHD